MCLASAVACSSGKLKTHECIVEGLGTNARATLCLPSGEKVAVTDRSIVRVPASRSTLQRIENPLVDESDGKIAAAAIDRKGQVAYFVTDNGFLYRYAERETPPLYMATEPIAVDPKTVRIDILPTNTAARFTVSTREGTDLVRYNAESSIFTFEN